MNRKNTRGNLLLLLATMIWGSAFVAQDRAMDHMGPYTFQALRSFVGAAVLLPVILISWVRRKKAPDYLPPTKKDVLYLLRAGATCGFFLAIAAGLQQVGLAMGADPGKAGFLTALYMFFVPIFGLFLKKRPAPHIWPCILVAAVGMYFLCLKKGEFSFAAYDLLILGCSVAFGIQILSIDHFAPRVIDCIALSALQFFFCGLFTLIPMLIFEYQLDASALLAAAPYILYVGVLSNGVAYTLQIVGQKLSEQPTLASLIMSFESVFAILTGIVIPPHVIPNGRELFGCVLIMIAILVAQIPFPKRRGCGA